MKLSSLSLPRLPRSRKRPAPGRRCIRPFLEPLEDRCLMSGAGDTVGDTFATAQLLNLTADGSVSTQSAIDASGDVDFYRFVAPVTQTVTVRQQRATGSNLDSLLTAYNSSQTQLASNDDFGGAVDSQFSLSVVAGQTYYIKAAAFSTSTGAYVLAIDAIGNGFADAKVLTPAADGSITVQSTIDYSGDADFYRFVAPVTQTVNIRQQRASGSSLDSILTAYNSSQSQLATNDDFNGAVDSQFSLSVVAGQTYYLKAAAFGTSTGAYVLAIDPVGNTFADAKTLTLAADGSASVQSTIDYSGDEDMYRFVASTTGLMTVRQQKTTGSSLDTFLYAYNGSQALITSNDNRATGITDSQVTFQVSAGQTYYLKAAASGTSTGAYTLILDPIASTFTDSKFITLAADGSANVQSAIDYSGDEDMYRFVAGSTGLMTVRQQQVTGSTLDSFLYAYNGSQSLITSNDDRAAGTTDSQVSFQVVAGQTYYLKAAAFDTSTGAYALILDPVASTFTDSKLITLAADGSANVQSAIDYSGDEDMYRFVASTTGLMTVRQQQVAGSTLDSFLYAYNGSQSLITSNDDRAAGTTDSQVSFQVVAGQTYYLKAAAFSTSTGAYALILDPVANTFADARLLALAADGSASTQSAIDYSGDEDMYRFVASTTGLMTVRQQQVTGSTLDSFLYAYNGSQSLITSNDDRASGIRDSEVSFQVVAGQTYYLKAAAFQTSTGAYALILDPVASTITDARQITLAADGSASVLSAIDYLGDQDMYRFTANVTGTLKIEQQKTTGSSLDSYLYAYDAAGNPLAEDDDSGGNRNSQLSLAVVAGQTYYLKATAFNSASTGGYELRITPAPDLVGEAFQVLESGAQWGATVTISYTIRNQGTANADSSWAVPVLSSDGSMDFSNASGNDVLGLQSARIIGLAPGASETNTLQITLPDTPPAGFPATGAVYLGFIIDYLNEVSEANENNNRNRGIGLDLDQFPILGNNEAETNNDAAHANSILPNATIDGSIGPAGDVDDYRIDITTGGYLDVTVNQRGGSTLDSRLTLSGVDSFLSLDGMPIGGGGLMLSSDDQSTGNVNPRLRQYLLPGAYYLAVSSVATGAAGTGDYRLTAQFTAASNPFNLDVTAPVTVGDDPRAIIAADFNRDGILDLAVVNRGSGDVSVLLGLGDGNFEPERRFDVPDAPTEIVAFDFNNDGRLDLATIDQLAGFVSLLPGVGDGNFLPSALERVPVADPRVAGIINRPSDIPDGGQVLSRLNVTEDLPISDVDVIVDMTHDSDQDLSVFLVGPDGTRIELFSHVTTGVSVLPGVGAVSHDFRSVTLDDAALEPMSAVSMHERGRFQPAQALSAFDGKLSAGQWTLEVHDDTVNGQTGKLLSWSLVVNGKVFSNYSGTTADFDFNRDGDLDEVALEPKNGNGLPPYSSQLAVGLVIPASSGATVDLTSAGLIVLPEDFPASGDLRPQQQVPVEALVQGSLFLATDRTPSEPIQATPFLADLDGDTAPDALLVRENGDIVLRRGVVGDPGQFEPPVVLNADRSLAPAARALAILEEGTTAAFAAIDLFSNSLSIYRRQADGSWRRTDGEDTGLLPLRIAAGDLDGDGRKDLVVANAELSTLSFYIAQANGSFTPTLEVKLGRNLSDVVLADVNGDEALDVLVTDPNSGSVAALINRKMPAGQLGFLDERRFRADTGTYGAVEGVSAVANDEMEDLYGLGRPFPAQYFVYAPSATSGVASGDFNNDGVEDLVAVNRGSNSFGLLLGKGSSVQPLGSYVDPVTFSTGPAPTAIRVADLNGDNNLDVVVLNSGDSTLSIFLGDGNGGFTQEPIRPLAGNVPTGLSIQDVDGDGVKDILIGNRYGDLLTLIGRGNGTFNPYQRTAHSVAISVMDINGDGKDDIIYGNESLDRVVIRYDVQNPDTVKQEFQNRTNGVLAPGAVQLADLNGDGLQDLLVANGGGTSLLVYLGIGNGQFGARQEFFVGTNPAGITVADLNNDQIPDVVVANRGSNDVSILLGRGQGASWTLTNGQRLDVGAGPVSTAVADVTGDGNPDIFVSNQQDGTVTQLTGTGGGFFNDQNAPLFPVGVLPGNVFVGNFDGTGGADLVTVNAGSNNITLIPNLNLAATINFSSQGVAPVAGLVRDFNRDGISDLAVANNADGVVALLLGGENGFTLNATFDASGTNPTALAENGNVLYVGHEGEQVLTFNLSFGEPAGDAAGGGANRAQVTALAPLEGGGLAVVVTLRTAGNFGPREANPEFFAEDAIGLIGLIVVGDAGLDWEEIAGNFNSLEILVGADWSRLYDEEQPVIVFIIGLDETRDWLRAEAQRRLDGQPTTPVTTQFWQETVGGIIRSFAVAEVAAGWQNVQQALGAVPQAIGQAVVAAWQAFNEAISSEKPIDSAPPVEMSSAEPMAELPPAKSAVDRRMPLLAALLVPVVSLLGPWFPAAKERLRCARTALNSQASCRKRTDANCPTL